MNLFDHHRQQQIEAEAPLAARMRPRTLQEYVGQGHILAPGRLLRRAIEADQLSSLIFYGPPGTGKTTLARVIANRTQADFIAINAVLAGVQAIRDAIARAQERRGQFGQRTLLFIDEVHRFNKAQQDALLPWVENGTVILIGATTENPYFEVNKALVSRSRVFQLKPLSAEDLRQIVQQTLQDQERGYGQQSVELESTALAHLINVANGDARALLNALELAVETTPPNSSGTIHISLSVAEESIQQRAVLYDKEGDAHFDTISAFIKSLRGSDPDAALYWLARMIYSGENPHYLFRRMLVMASEDIGLADSQAIVVVQSCAATFDRVGLPEGHYALAHAALYLANAPKSNSVLGFFDALKLVEQEQADDVPNHLKDATRDRNTLGHGAGYRYPHAYRDHWVAQQYLPGNLQGQVFYQPSNQGAEDQIRRQVARRREEQLAALLDDIGTSPVENLTFSPPNKSQDRWLQRTIGQLGQRLGQVRDRIFTLAHLQRHHIVLDLNAGTGLLTWEALRQVPEGGVYARTITDAEAKTLRELAENLPSLQRPIVFSCPDLDQITQPNSPIAEVRFDCVIGRNALTANGGNPDDWSKLLSAIADVLTDNGQVILAETIPLRSQRLYRWLQPGWFPADLYQRLVAAEDSIYDAKQPASQPSLNWDVEQLSQVFTTTGLQPRIEIEQIQADLRITPALIDRWFHVSPQSNSPDAATASYADHLSQQLTSDEIQEIKTIFMRHLSQQVLSWDSAIAIVQAL
ncbi:MAG: AAA family ATPase [Thainema sp.]